MADNQRQIDRLVQLTLGVEGAQDAARAVERVGQSADRLESRFKKVTVAAKKFGGALDFIADFSSSLIAAQYGVQQAFQALGISGSQRELANYSRTLLLSRQQFAKFDESIVATERRILMLKDRFAFTRQEVATLQAQFDKGFSFQAPNRMVQVFDVLREVVGENVDAMMRLQTSVQQIGQKVPIYQELFSYGVANRSEKISKSARNMSRALLAAAAIAGDITLDELKEQLGAMAQLDRARGAAGQAAKDAAEAQARTQQLNDNIRTLNELKVLWEDITMKVAQGLQPVLKWINNQLQAGGETLENWVALGLKIGSAFAAIGAINLASSLGKIATSATSGLGFLANARNQTQSRNGAFSGGLLSNFASVGAFPNKPLYVVVVGDWTAGPGSSSIYAGGAGPSGKGSKAKGFKGRLSSVGKGLGKFALPALAIGSIAYGMGIGGDALSPDGSNDTTGVGSTLGRFGSSALQGAGIGMIGGPKGAAIGAAIGVTIEALKSFTVQLYETSDAVRKANDSYESSLQYRKMNAGSESEYVLADLELQRKRILDSMDAERAKNSTLFAGLYSQDSGIASEFMTKGKLEVMDFLPPGYIANGMNWVGEQFGWITDNDVLEKQQKELDSINDQLKKTKKEVEKAEEAQESQKDTLSATDKVLIGFVARYQLLNSFIQLSNRRYDASLSRLGAIADLQSRMAGAQSATTEFNLGSNIQEVLEAASGRRTIIESARQAVAEFSNIIAGMDLNAVANEEDFVKNMKQSLQSLPQLGEVVSDEIMQRLGDIGSATQLKMFLDTTMAEIEKAAIESRTSMSDILSQASKAFDGEQELARSFSDRVAADVELATNLAAGVAPSAEMRMEQVRAIQGEISAAEKRLSFFRQAKEAAESAMRAAAESGDEAAMDDALAGRAFAEKKINETVAERTQLMAKQASITKVIRDGYISAIAAMSTGAGMFTQITIDQNKNLGQLQAATNNAVVSLRSGAMARGLTTSERFTAGGIMSEGRRFGASDDVNQLITESNPLGAFFDVEDDMRDGISSTGARIVEVWQQEAGRFFSTMGESLRTQPYGTAELQDYISENQGTATIGNGRVPGTVPVQIEVEGRNRGGIIGDGATGPNRDSTLVAMTTGEGVLTRETVAQNGGSEFVDSLNSGITIEGMMDAARKREREEMAKQLDEFNLRGASRIKERFLKDFPYLWHEKLYKDESFYDLSSMTDGSTFTADQYEALNERYMTVRRRLGNLRYLLPSPSMTQQKISEREDEVHAQYEALMGEFASSDMARFGTDPNPLLQATEEAVRQAESFRQQIREQRSPLQAGIDDMSFAARMSELSETPLGVRVPSLITDLAAYNGATRSAQDISTGEQQSAYDQWRNGIVEEMEFFTRKMKARIKATRRGSDKRYGNKQLAAWRSIAEDLIKRGKPYDYMADPNFVGPIPPSPGESPQIPGGLTDADASASYEEMQAELDRRKEIITNRMIAWRRDQANAIMAQLASAESVSAKTAIVAQLEDFDVNSQRIYERLEDARHPAQLAEMLPQLRELGVRGIGDNIFDIEVSQTPAIRVRPASASDMLRNDIEVYTDAQGAERTVYPRLQSEFSDVASIRDHQERYDAAQRQLQNVVSLVESILSERSRRDRWVQDHELLLQDAMLREDTNEVDRIIGLDRQRDTNESSRRWLETKLPQMYEDLSVIHKAAGLRSGLSERDIWKPDYPEYAFPTESYATGGIAAPRPGGQLARLAEAGKSEAVVPLPDGSSIPVMFQNDSASMASMPEPIMNSVSTGVNGYLDSPGSSITEGSQRVEIALSSQDKKRVADSFVAEMTAMMTTVIQRSEQRILDDLRVRR
tara:strand:+ start:15787 stop:21297 length:5511 start_codon:yes stop_codon:yes gene_type:complete